MITPEKNEDIRSTENKFRTYIKHKKRDKNGVVPLRRNGKLETDQTDKANILNDMFPSVFSAS